MDTSAASHSWSQPEQVDPTAQLDSSLADLGNLFEFGDIDLNTISSSIHPAQFDEHMQHAGTHPSTPFDELTEAQASSWANAQIFGAQGQYALHQGADEVRQQQTYAGLGQTSNTYTSDQNFQTTVQQQQQQAFHLSQQFQFPGTAGFSLNQYIPPTPNSFEMHGESGRFIQNQDDSQQRALLAQRYQPRKEDAFTPTVSPAGTPQYNVQPEFTIPGAYFSPLTSPMLHAQNSQKAQARQQYQQGFYTNPSTAPSSNTTSPLDTYMDVDMLADDISLTETTDPKTRKASSRRKVPTTRSAGPLARVKQSPIQKAVKRKSGTMLTTLSPPKEGDASLDLLRSKSAQPNISGLRLPRNDSSENGSVSPEPLSESVMGPPPRPLSSKTNSPAMRAHRQSGNGGALGAAATPKSLLSKRQNQASTPGSTMESTQGISNMDLEDLDLPASVADNSVPPRSLARLSTHVASGEATPGLSARKTPKLGPTSTPSSAQVAAAVQSPAIAASPMTASTPGELLKDHKYSKSGRGLRKRSSVSAGGSSMVSPALRPRISPSIKPLLPDGASLHSPTHALLLASKSNYQNLLEGNQLPGVNYPESLSTGLTSKRTSHKVAEQGRRNRINDALKEMQSLLPKPPSTKGKDNSNSEESPEAAAEPESKDSKDDAAKSNSSKAATVESANEYIRKLQKENAELLLLKKEYEEVKKQLENASGLSSAGSEVGEAATKSSPSPIDIS